jgi:phosphatidylinositol alpha-mannosyltransferase
VRSRASGDPHEVTGGWAPEVVAACEFLGAVSDDDKASLLASVDVYVAPNTGGESFGIILIEAMSSGACVLASDLPAFSRVLDGGSAGAMFANEQPDDLARVLVDLLRDDERRGTLAAAGQGRAHLFDWSVVAGRIIAVYETVIEGRAAATPPPGRWGRLLPRGRPR